MKSKINNYKFHIVFTLSIVLINLSAEGQHGAKYWVQFTDKKQIPYSINKPEQFLSSRAIQRRLRNNVPVTEEDLPVSTYYADSLNMPGVKVMYTSKWFNSATIEVNDTSAIEIIKNYSFVKAVENTADAVSYKNGFISNKFKDQFSPLTNPDESLYNYGYTQIKLENGVSLHKLGFRGKGIQIALIDAGFQDADIYVSLDSLRNANRILSTKNFVDLGQSVYNDVSHGAEVLSTIAADLPGTFVGTAPDASFILLCSEDVNSEYPVEEDNWVAAAEYADSAGADIISTSLGYTTFDDPVFNNSYIDMNGETTRISLAATIASSKGIIVVVSAGNEGDNSWHYISAPADAKNILTAGAVTSDSLRAIFSSFGPSADGRIKPDVMAMGEDVAVESSPGQFLGNNGTSFSAPIIAGLTACLVQAFPAIRKDSVMDAIRKSSNLYERPNFSYGYGIPDFNKAYNLLQGKIIKNANTINIFPNPFQDNLYFNLNFPYSESIKIMCYNSIGKLIFVTTKPASDFVILQTELQSLKQGLYIFKCYSNNQSWVLKAVKQ